MGLDFANQAFGRQSNEPAILRDRIAPRAVNPRPEEFFDRAFLRLGVLDGTAGLTFAALSAGNMLLTYLKLAELTRNAEAQPVECRAPAPGAARRLPLDAP